MYELTLCLTADRQKYVHEFCKTVECDIKKLNGIMVKQNAGGKCYLAMAIDEKNKDYLKSLVLDFVLKVVIEEFKFNFFKDQIVIKNHGKVTDAFLVAVSIFDAEIDKEIISSLLEFKDEIVIESFYYFKLQGLKERWLRTANIISQNGIMNNERSMIDVMKYLCAVSDNNSVLVNLMINNGKIEMRNFSKARKFKTDKEGISNLYAEMIKLNPMKINIKLDEFEPEFEEITSTLKSVFEDKIYFN